MDNSLHIKLAKEFGTPLYIINENKIRRACRKFKDAMYKNYGKDSQVLYASKALSCIKLYKIINSENMELDVVSGGELYTALKSGFPMEKIHFHGNNKSLEELIMAIDLGVGRIVVDNEEELEKITNLRKQCNILIRVRPGIDVTTHSAIKTGTIDSKFGFSFEESEEVVKKVIKNDKINFKGFHCHIGSQIFDSKSFEKSAEIMMDFIGKIFLKLGVKTDELNLGGGFGVKYTKNDPEPNINEFIFYSSEKIKQKSIELNIKQPFVYIEPGRGIVAQAGVTLYTVGSIKKTKNETYVIVDGSMADNPRFTLYRADHEVINISEDEFDCSNKKNTIKERVTIAGKCCESGDIIAKNVEMRIPQIGDILKVRCTGAYNFSMASNYNKLCRPAMILINDKKAQIIVKRQTYDDLISSEL
ncbi:MAG: diaminopimelate decarboxylase [Oscillospiraceae bacterium]|jgi:diaminopimelate decarboxylase|nr:diaminopimelate decarboxylase [Oscillospiraceae bacterium]